MLAKVDITTKTEITDFTSPCLFKSSHLFYCRALSNNPPGAAKVPQSHLKALSFIFMIISDINKTVTKAENVKLTCCLVSVHPSKELLINLRVTTGPNPFSGLLCVFSFGGGLTMLFTFGSLIVNPKKR